MSTEAEAVTDAREAAAMSDSRARGLLWKISGCTSIPASEAAGLVDDYDDVRAFVRILRAGWAASAPDGLLVTERGRDVAGRLFAGHPPAWNSETASGLTDEQRERKAAMIQMLADREQRPPMSREEIRELIGRDGP